MEGCEKADCEICEANGDEKQDKGSAVFVLSRIRVIDREDSAARGDEAARVERGACAQRGGDEARDGVAAGDDGGEGDVGGGVGGLEECGEGAARGALDGGGHAEPEGGDVERAGRDVAQQVGGVGARGHNVQGGRRERGGAAEREEDRCAACQCMQARARARGDVP